MARVEAGRPRPRLRPFALDVDPALVAADRLEVVLEGRVVAVAAAVAAARRRLVGCARVREVPATSCTRLR